MNLKKYSTPGCFAASRLRKRRARKNHILAGIATLSLILFKTNLLFAAEPIVVDTDALYPLSIVKLVLQPGVKSKAYVGTDELLDEIAAEFKKYHYDARGVEDESIFGKTKKEGTRMVLGGKINLLDCTRILDYRDMYDCNMAVRWEVFDSKKEQVTYRVTTRSRKEFYLTPDSTLQELHVMLLANIHSLMSRPKFVDSLAKDDTGEESDAKVDPGHFASCDVQMTLPADLQKAISATVVIKTKEGTGSGFFISPDGLLLTAAHVVDGHNKVKMVDNNGNELDATVIRRDDKVDVALLKAQRRDTPCLPLAVATPGVGEDIYGIGAPAGEELSFSVARGIVSGVRNLDGRAMIQTDASINPGNSGGPMLSNDGQVIALVVQKLTGDGLEGLGFGVTAPETLLALNISAGVETSAFLLRDADTLAKEKTRENETITDDDDPDFSSLALVPSNYPHLGYYSFKQKKLYGPGRVVLLVSANALLVGGAVLGTMGFVKYKNTVSQNSVGDDVYPSESEFNKAKLMNIAGWAAAGAGLGLNLLFLATGKSQEKLDAESIARHARMRGPKRLKLKLNVFATGMTLNGSF
ncbi:MAG: serine protease [Deltaproteobacteria bacterium]|nr:serine protease [Deltaproteobacteria bacterium]